MLLALVVLVADSLLRPLGTIPPGVTDGYASTVRGEAFGYHSAHPTDRASLLVRSLDSTQAAVWTTAPVGSRPGGGARIAFLAAMDVTDPGQSRVRFWLTVNGRHRMALPQPASAAERWSIVQSGGVRLDFRRLLVDKFGDVHGVFTLELPETLAPPGLPVTIAVHGESVARRSWFILYTVSMRPTVSVHAEQMLARSEGKRLQTLRLDAWNPFERVPISVDVDGTRRAEALLEAGSATVRVDVPAVAVPTDVRIAVATPSGRAEFERLRLDPVTPRVVYLVPHSHLDIGYTDVHERVRDKHWAGFDSALAYVERSRAHPEGSRFRWTVEGLWALQDYLENRPAADTTRLMAAVRRGEIALTGFYANLMTGLSGTEELLELTAYARRLRERHGVRITSAMSSDVPGFTWGLVPTLAEAGIRHLSSGPNYMPGPSQDGDRIGRTLEAWGDRPFWWVGPGGQDSLLVLTAGRGYSWMGGWPRGRLALEDAALMSGYMEELVARGYPYEIVQVRYAIGGDNGYPDGGLADEVRRWNERFESPRIVLATVPELMEAFEAKYGDWLPTIRGDLTGYWEDGAVSSAREHVLNRASAARIVQAQALAALRGIALDAGAVHAAWRYALLWDEHTWGADRSISEPDAPDVVEQWRLKQRFALDADSASRALLARATHVEPAGSGVDAWNTHGFALEQVVILPAARSREGDRVVDARGRVLPSQRLADGSLAVQARLEPTSATRLVVQSGRAEPPSEPARATAEGLGNGLVSVRIDPRTGAISSVRSGGREFVDGRFGGWNRYLYVPGRDTTEALDASLVRVRVVDPGPLVATLRIEAEAPGAERLAVDVTLHAGDPAVFVATHLDKAGIREKEAVHLAFPLAVPGGTVRMEQGGAVVRPDADQADGANRHVYPVQRWLDASAEGFGVTVVTPDLALWQLNGLTGEAFLQPDGRQEWMRRSLPGTRLVAYAMNNYWHTNFKADQPGPVTFRTVLRAHGGFDAARATRWALAVTEPPIVLPAGSGVPAPTAWTLDSDDAVVSSWKRSPDGRADLVRLWNPGDRPVTAGLRWSTPPGSAWRSTIDGGRGARAPERVEIPPGSMVQLRIER